MQQVPAAALGALAALLSLAGPLAATDRYVDVVHGSDTNGGTSQTDAWRTITHAFSVGGADRLLVAPGTYSASTGEVFPLGDAMQLVGLRGSSATVIDGQGASVTLFEGRFLHLRGLTLRRADNGAVFSTTGDHSTTELIDVRIEDMRAWAFRGLMSPPGQYGIGILTSTLEHVRVSNCGAGGVSLACWAFSGDAQVHASDSQFVDNGGVGIELEDGNGHYSAHLQLDRCQVVGNAGDGVRGPADYTSGAMLYDSVLARNGGRGFSGTAWICRCTIADNTAAGASFHSQFFPGAVLSCILCGNGDDLAWGGSGVSASYCDIGDGDFAGTAGNISAPPRFVDAVNGDYRLQYDSPCLESADPGYTGSIDLAGNPRSFDGNLDTQTGPDMGAYELVPLVARGVPGLGATIELELWGPDAAPTIVFASRAPLASVPRGTLFGDFYLAPGSATVLAHTQTSAGPPNVLPVGLPSNPIWIGRELSFQALVDSGQGPGRALTNPVEITLRP